jgi:hypothetical protein
MVQLWKDLLYLPQEKGDCGVDWVGLNQMVVIQDEAKVL